MPLTSFKCDVTQQPVHFDACAGCADRGTALKMGCHHAGDVLRGIAKTVRKPMPGFSATELLDCPRALFLKKANEYSAKPSRLYFAFRGTMMHKVLEGGAIPGDISERRLYTEVLGTKLSGQPDLIRGDTIFDYKTAKVIPSEPQPHHIAQLSIYRWIASRQAPPIEIRKGAILYMDMTAHALYPCELWPLEKTRLFIEDKIKSLTASQEAPKFEDHFNPGDWRCGATAERSYCDVREHCTKGQAIIESGPSRPRSVKRTR